MRKFLACIALMTLVTVSANAQKRFQQGDWIAGGQISDLDFKANTDKLIADTEFEFSAFGGWFFADKFAVDALAGIYYINAGNKGGPDYTKGTDFVFGAGVRYYPVANLFVRLGYDGNVQLPGDLISYLDAKIGYDIFLSEMVFFEPAIYCKQKLNKGNFGLRGQTILGLSLGFGVKF